MLQTVKTKTQNCLTNRGNLLVHVTKKHKGSTGFRKDSVLPRTQVSFHVFPLSSADFWRLAFMTACRSPLGCRLPHSGLVRMKEPLSHGSLQKPWHFLWLLFVRSCNCSWFNHCSQEMWIVLIDLTQVKCCTPEARDWVSFHGTVWSPEGSLSQKGKQMLLVNCKVLSTAYLFFHYHGSYLQSIC
jgi:hypothetical protein